MEPEKASQLRSAFVWTVVLTVVHFALGTRTHAVHGLHIALAGLFMVPVIIATAAAISGIYLLHLLLNWRNSPLSNPDQFAWPVVYVVVGLTAGQLVHTANYRKWQRDEVISKSQRTEMVQGLTGLLTALGVRDAATLAHSRRVAAIAVRLGEHMGLDRGAVSNLRLAGLVHDIGKAGVPDDILFKDGRLSEEQTVVMRSHVDLAVSMLRAIPGTDAIARIVSQHHECPDGSGYPRGLLADAVDPAASILRVADVYAALTEPRPYHTPADTNTAIAAMSALSGSKIDATAFAALRAVVGHAAASDIFESEGTPAFKELNA
ncbi:HD domain-containing protein [Leptolyngbya sp. 15MV]|nr:HD domain-containing protein [Leptolyngbya sp. 15MV]